MTKKNYSIFDVIGIMSGTSTDGLDIAWCRFMLFKNDINYQIIKGETIPYDPEWTQLLLNAHNLPLKEFLLLNQKFGQFIGQQALNFVQRFDIKPFCIASHGHTIFHNPSENFSFQIGHGAFIAAITGIDTVSDFRNLDMALDGQGAPLVSYGDLLLFNQYDAALNLGGFANITILKNKQEVAFDICPVNFVLNRFANMCGKEIDKDGEIASKGKLNASFFEFLEKNTFYKDIPSHSLSREWVEKNILSDYPLKSIPIEDLLHTFTEHIAGRISAIFEKFKIYKCLVTGGGAYNKFLIQKIRQLSPCNLITPNNKLIEYKEALIFALLGLLRKLEKENILCQFTKSKYNSSSGALWKGKIS